MINEELRAGIETAFRGGRSERIARSTLTESELRQLRSEIEAMLPQDNLSNLNLETELVRQYRKVLELQDDVLTDDTVPANQRAQVAGQVASTLQHLIKMQTEFHTAERFKALENLMIKHMRRLPKDVAEAFLDEYAEVAP
jgi:ABC-type glutathione transport system ATPase component